MYDASTDVDKWPIFLEIVAKLTASKGAQIAHYGPDRNHHNFNFIHGFDFDRETLESIEHPIPDDPRFQYGLANAPKPIHCRMAVTTEELHATEIYKQLLAPAGIEYSAAVMLPLEDGLMTFLALFRTQADPVYTDEDCALLGEFVPHLKRAIGIFKKLPDSQVHDRIVPDLFDNVPIGIIVVDLDGAIHFVNEAARSLADSNGIHVDGERIDLGSTSQNAELRAAIAACIKQTLAVPVRSSGEVMTTRGEDRLMIRVNPLANHRKEKGYASVVDHRSGAPPRSTERAADAAVRAIECRGAPSGTTGFRTERQTSRRRPGHRRRHRAFISKGDLSDTHRQTDLVRLVLSTPVWIQANKQEK